MVDVLVGGRLSAAAVGARTWSCTATLADIRVREGPRTEAVMELAFCSISATVGVWAATPSGLTPSMLGLIVAIGTTCEPRHRCRRLGRHLR